jgi:hypothetical protein
MHFIFGRASKVKIIVTEMWGCCCGLNKLEVTSMVGFLADGSEHPVSINAEDSLLII